MSYIYKITNQINGKIYIGKTNNTIQERFKEHCEDSQKNIKEKRPLYAAMRKYGIEHFVVEQIEECSLEEVNEKEKYWIEYYGSFKNGYNATLGGDGKAYIDRELVIKTYNELQSQKEVAQILHISEDSVHSILKENHIKTIPQSEVIKKKYGHKIAMIDVQTNKIILTFSTQSDAARWLIKQAKTTITDTQKISYIIGRVVRGLRKTAYGYAWKSIE